MMMQVQKIVPHLWFEKGAREAAEFYVSLLPDSRIDHVTALPTDSPSGPAGTVEIVEFTLAGQQFMAMAAGKLDPFNHAISFLVRCESQAEIDRLWDGLMAGGGHPEQCGWLRDRYGVAWQIVPSEMDAMMRDPDRAAVKRAADAMLKMVKLDIAALRRAYEGEKA